MFGELLKYGIGLLNRLFVLFHFVVFDDTPEKISLLFGQRTTGPRLWIIVDNLRHYGVDVLTVKGVRLKKGGTSDNSIALSPAGALDC
jgi:hypothetical protein